MFNNARTYNQEGSWVYVDADEMENSSWDAKWETEQDIVTRLRHPDAIDSERLSKRQRVLMEKRVLQDCINTA